MQLLHTIRRYCNGDQYYWLIKLTVTDAAGLSTSDLIQNIPQLCASGTH